MINGLIEIVTNATKILDSFGQPMNGSIRVAPCASFEYTADSQRKQALGTAQVIEVENGRLAQPLLLAPTSGAEHNKSNLFYSVIFRSPEISCQYWELPATSENVVEFNAVKKAIPINATATTVTQTTPTITPIYHLVTSAFDDAVSLQAPVSVVGGIGSSGAGATVSVVIPNTPKQLRNTDKTIGVTGTLVSGGAISFSGAAASNLVTEVTATSGLASGEWSFDVATGTLYYCDDFANGALDIQFKTGNTIITLATPFVNGTIHVWADNQPIAFTESSPDVILTVANLADMVGQKIMISYIKA